MMFALSSGQSKVFNEKKATLRGVDKRAKIESFCSDCLF